MNEVEQEIRDGDRAKQLLEDPLFQKIFDELEKQYFETWKGADPSDSKGREVLWQLLWSTEQVRNFFNVIMDRGEIHKTDISRSMKRKS